MTGRAKTGGFSEDLAKTPGPGRYNGVDPNVSGKKAPGYSMLGRSYMPGGKSIGPYIFCIVLTFFHPLLVDSTKKPGPGAHKPEGVTCNKPKAPSFSLGIRHSEYITPLIIDVPE